MDRIAMVHEGRLAFNRGDVDAMLEHYDPDAEIFPITAGGIEGRGFRGQEAGHTGPAR